jgi:hypothetical protein
MTTLVPSTELEVIIIKTRARVNENLDIHLTEIK